MGALTETPALPRWGKCGNIVGTAMPDPIKQPASAPEPWLSGTLQEVPAVGRAVLHALELAKEDLQKWCSGLSDAELNARPASLASVAFHLRHIARSVDRLLTYAEARELATPQLNALKRELENDARRSEVFTELLDSLDRAAMRIRALAMQDVNEPRAVGRQRLPATLGGLLVHVADHTQRHVGQAITTAKLILAGRSSGSQE